MEKSSFKKNHPVLHGKLTAIWEFLQRSAMALAWSGAFALLVWQVQRMARWTAGTGWNSLFHLRPGNMFGVYSWGWSQWVFPLLAAVGAAYVYWGISVKVGTISMRFGPITWDRNAFCRGWLILGTTGSGKTECGINILLHGLFSNEKGKERKTWDGSEAKKILDKKFAEFLALEASIGEGIEKNTANIEGVMVDKDRGVRAANGPDGKPSLKTLELAMIERSLVEADKLGAAKAATTAELERIRGEQAALRTANAGLRHKLVLARRDLNDYDNKTKELRYELYPWGGLCLDQKGMFWQILLEMARHYKRDADLMLLQTRPDDADPDWSPPARFNLISYLTVPASTYAAAISKTAAAVSGGEGDKGFFKVQAESNIGWGIELMRAVREAQEKRGWHLDPEKRKRLCTPALDKLNDILSNKQIFFNELEAWGCYIPKDKSEVNGVKVKAEIKSDRLRRSLLHFDLKYWSQPEDQLGGVIGTIYTYIAFFTGDEIAEVFCRENTFDMADMEKGKLVCIAMPQKLATERRYIATIMKILFYQHAQRRFDRFDQDSKKFNLILCLQDEAQRFFIPEDGDVDTLRQAQATTIMATQSQKALFAALGGKDKAEEILSNLCNRLTGRAGDQDCAQASATFIGQTIWKERSYSKGVGKASVSISFKEDYKISAAELRNLSDFTFIVSKAGGLNEKMIIRPATTKGKVPFWWTSKADNIKNESKWLWFKMKFLGLSEPFTVVKMPKEFYEVSKRRGR